MDLSELIEVRAAEARSVIEKCVGKSGIWASSELETKQLPGYAYLLYPRDFDIAGIDGLPAVGRIDLVLKNLASIKLAEDGSAPTYFVDEGFDRKADKIRLAREDPKRIPRYAVKLVMEKLGISSPHRHTPRSTDSTLHYINAIITCAERTGETQILDSYGKNIEHALRFVRTQVDDVLYRGGDWRDNMRFSRDVALLSNNALLFHIYKSLGYHDEAALLKEKIQKRFWRASKNSAYHSDHPDTDKFDTFGQALAVLYGVADKNQYSGIAAKFKELETDFGIKANDYNLSEMSMMARWRNRRVNQCGTILEWAMAQEILALETMGYHELAVKNYYKWTALRQFREHHKPLTGEGLGAVNFMGSAAPYLRVGQVVGLIKK